MKKLLTIAAIAAATSALAVESSNTFGILRVDSSAAQTIVSVPWEAAGGGEIKVADIVKTANLNEGDELYYYNGTDYTMWRLTAGVWVEAQNGEGELTNQDIPRGGAIILKRNAPIAPSFYLYGQYTNAASSTTCVAGGYTLLAPPSTDETDLNTKTWTTPGENDNIILQNTTVLHYRNVSGTMKWGKLKKTLDEETGTITETVDPLVAKIAAGEGAWYHNNQDTAVTVQW